MSTIHYLVSELDTNDGAGIYRVANEIFRAIAADPPCGWRILPVRCSDDGAFRLAKAFMARFPELKVQVGDADGMSSLQPGDILLSVDLVYDFKTAHEQELRRFRAIGGGVFFVVYDLIPLLYPHWFSDRLLHTSDETYLAIFEKWFDFIARHATGIIAISRAVRDDVACYLETHVGPGGQKTPVNFFHMGTSLALRSTDRTNDISMQAMASMLGSRKSFLLVGTVEPRKGHLLAVDALDRLWAQGFDCNLIFVGKKGSTTLFSGDVDAILYRIQSHSEYGRRLLWLDSIPDEMLAAAYKNATALLQLSLSEGFGLPMIEAASFGLPLIVRDIPINREICGVHATYFAGQAADDLANVIAKWLDGEAGGTVPRSDSLKFLTWEGSAKELLAVVGNMQGIEFRWR